MSYNLVLKKNGIICTKEWVYDEEKEVGSYVVTELPVNRILSHLQYHVEEIEEDFTLRSYFMMIENYPDLIKLDNFFDPYLDEVKECPPEGCVSDNMPFLKLQRMLTVELDKDGKTIDFQNYVSFDGENTEPESGGSWGIEFTPLDTLLDIPLKVVNTTVYITTLEEYKVIKNVEYSGEDFMTLFDFVCNVIWELSFLGTPENRDRKSDEMHEMVEDVKSGKAELIPWEELKL